MEVYSPRKKTAASFSKNEVKREKPVPIEKDNVFYDIEPVKSRRENFSEWITRKFYEPMRIFFEKDVVE
jgi:hypothetical protein